MMFPLTEESHLRASSLQGFQLSPTHWLYLFLVYCNWTCLACAESHLQTEQHLACKPKPTSPGEKSGLANAAVQVLVDAEPRQLELSSTCTDIPVSLPLLLWHAVLVNHHCFLPDLWTILLPGAKELESFAGAAHRPAVQVTMKKPTFPRSSQTGAKDRDAAGLPSYGTETPGLGSQAEATSFSQMNSKSEAEDYHGAYKNSSQASPLR